MQGRADCLRELLSQDPNGTLRLVSRALPALLDTAGISGPKVAMEADLRDAIRNVLMDVSAPAPQSHRDALAVWRARFCGGEDRTRVAARLLAAPPGSLSLNQAKARRDEVLRDLGIPARLPAKAATALHDALRLEMLGLGSDQRAEMRELCATAFGRSEVVTGSQRTMERAHQRLCRRIEALLSCEPEMMTSDRYQASKLELTGLIDDLARLRDRMTPKPRGGQGIRLHPWPGDGRGVARTLQMRAMVVGRMLAGDLGGRVPRSDMFGPLPKGPAAGRVAAYRVQIFRRMAHECTPAERAARCRQILDFNKSGAPIDSAIVLRGVFGRHRQEFGAFMEARIAAPDVGGLPAFMNAVRQSGLVPDADQEQHRARLKQ